MEKNRRKPKSQSAYYAPENTEGEFLTRRQASVLLRCSLTTLDRLQIKKIRDGRRIIYRRCDILDWAELNARIEMCCDE
jgi:hypothetical protein